jgi:hypothetical protein
MHATNAGEKRKLLKRDARELARDAKTLQKAARIAPEARQKAQRLQEEADKALAEAQALKPQAKLEDLHVWQMEKEKATKKGSRKYTYWMASWREGDKTRNVHLGSCGKMSQAEALQKAKAMKAEALAIDL